MRGVWFEDGQVTLRDDLQRPAPAPGRCRVRVSKAGVCATDLALRAGYMDFRGVPGHEFVRVITTKDQINAICQARQIDLTANADASFCS